MSGLRDDTEMSDVTLITEDKVKILAHKIILSSCSNVFNFILKESKQSNPLVYLGGISSVNLGFILDYIYYGEVNLYQEQLDGFIESAQKLEIEGLQDDKEWSDTLHLIHIHPSTTPPSLPLPDIICAYSDGTYFLTKGCPIHR